MHLRPFHGIKFFVEYFARADQVKAGNKKLRHKFDSIFVLFGLQSLHFLYQYWRKFSKLEEIIHGDYATVACLTRNAYLLVIGICALSVYILRVLYLPNPNGTTLRLLHDVLIKQKTDFFSTLQYKNQPVCGYVRKFALAYLNLFNQFVLIIS